MSPTELVQEQQETAGTADITEDTQTIQDISIESDDLSVLPVIPLRDTVVFPNMAVPLRIGRPQSLGALEAALGKDRQVLLVAESTTQEHTVTSEALFRVGTVTKSDRSHVVL